MAPPVSARSTPLRSRRFLALYALASAGGVIAYLPLLTLLLPIRVAEIAGSGRFGLLSLVAILGAVVASGANILAGWLSDRSLEHGGGRRRWVGAGTTLLLVAYAGVAAAREPVAIVAAVIGVQVAVNLMLAPLMAILADEVPAAQMGMASALLSLGAPVASAFASALVSVPAMGPEVRLMTVALVAALCTAPFLFTRPLAATADPAADTRPPRRPRDLAIAWLARLLVQIAGVAVSLYLYYYFDRLGGGRPDGVVAVRVGQLMTIAYVAAIPAAIVAGRVSDKWGRRRAILFASAAVSAAGLALMAVAADWAVAAAGFGLFAVGSAVFLALHSGMAILLLPSARRRGRDLGLVNLTNTVPSLLGPALAWSLVVADDVAPALPVLAALTLAGGALMLAVRGD